MDLKATANKEVKSRINEIRVSILFVFLAILFVSCLIISNIMAAKIIKVGNWSVSSGVIVFPISFILNDMITEVYGLRKVKIIIYMGLIIELFMIVMFKISVLLPAPEWFENAEAYEKILSNTPRTVVASLAAYFFGSLSNAYIMDRMKHCNSFEIRAIISTIVGEFVDSIFFVPIAFLFLIPNVEIFRMIAIQVLGKTIYEIIVLPLTKRCVSLIKSIELDDVVFDDR